LDLGKKDRSQDMKIYLDCIPCFLRQALDAVKLATDNQEVHENVMREVLRSVADLDMRQSPPEIGQQIHRRIRNLIGAYDPYHRVKGRFNDLALELYSKYRKQVIESEDPLKTAICLAIAGNIIDLGVKSSVDESDLHRVISESVMADIDTEQLESFRDAIGEAEKILYLADNAGEIVFDHLLIEQLPYEKVTVVVRGMPVINDATKEDAWIIGLDRIVDVIDNGSDAPGTILKSCSQKFLSYFEEADLIIAKGQGNYESLSDIDKNIFFLLKAKCPVIARDLGCEVGDMIIQKSKAFQENWIEVTEDVRKK